MRRTKSLLSVACALALAAGTAFADGDSMAPWQTHESSNPELVSEPAPMNEPEALALEAPDAELYAEPDVIYVYPVEVTEYYILVPSADSEMPRG